MAGQEILQGYWPIGPSRHTRVSSRDGGILGAQWRRMLELVEDGREVVVHGDVAGSLGIFPVDCQATVPCTNPVDGDGVQLVEGLD